MNGGIKLQTYLQINCRNIIKICSILMVKALCSKQNMGHTKLDAADRATRFKTQTIFIFLSLFLQK